MSSQYDAIIIGTGQAGPSLASRLAGAGRKVAIIERKRFGGTCVNVGCIPTKTLVASAYAAHVARHAQEFGVNVEGSVSVDMKAVKSRKDRLVRVSTEGVEQWLKSMENCTVYEGHARFESPKTVRVNGELLEADQIFINVGCRASTPPIPGLDKVKHFNNSSMMDVDFLPEHLLIVGGGYIGLEFGQMYRRFGSKVTILARGPRVLSRDDDDVAQAVMEILEGEGVTFLKNLKDFSVEQRGDKISICVNCGGSAAEVEGSHLLVAVGRIPNIEDLGLEKAGVALNKRGFIQVDDQLQTSQAGIWALGDCNGLSAFTHTSYNDFEVVAANLLDHDPRRVSDRISASGLFTDPPLGKIGLTEKEVRASGRKALIGKMPMSRVGRAREKGDTRGFMKVLVDAETQEILGAALLGIGCDEVVHQLLDIMYAKVPYTVVQRAMHIHPTVSELIPTLLGDLQPLEST